MDGRVRPGPFSHTERQGSDAQPHQAARGADPAAGTRPDRRSDEPDLGPTRRRGSARCRRGRQRSLRMAAARDRERPRRPCHRAAGSVPGSAAHRARHLLDGASIYGGSMTAQEGTERDHSTPLRSTGRRWMDGARGSEHVETVIIGGGQAGLATGYHLARRDLPFVILDANERIGDAWRKRWDSLRLFTPARYNGLPGWPFPAPAWSFPTKDEVADYLEAYAARFDLPVQTGVRVDGLSREADRYVLTAGDRRFEADHVVVASGAYQRPRIPALASELDPGIVQLHSSEYRDPCQLQEGGVLVVGAANSGVEIALEVSRNHRTWLSGRHTGQEPYRPGSSRWDRLLIPVIWFMASHVLIVK